MYSKSELKSIYDEHVNHYNLVCATGKTLLESKLKEAKIELLHVSQRVKSFESFYEKISRKKYQEPYKEIEDICGLRAICFYIHDLPKIGKIINETFPLSNTIDKTSVLELDQFGYRSNHYVVNLPDEVDHGELIKYKIEIQTRTVLMHTWAHIQGRLEYKQQDHTPQKFRRKLFQMSALLEMADEQFQNLKMEKDALRTSLITTKEGFSKTMEFNIDTFMSFIEVFFPKRESSYRYSKLLMKELIQSQIEFGQIIDSYHKAENYLPAIDAETGNQLSSEELLKLILVITNPLVRASFAKDELVRNWSPTIDKWSQILIE